MARIFLSYRRDDSSGHAGRLFDRLGQYFGRDNLFMDVDTIALGVDFVEAIQDAVGSCDVLLAVIGRQWLTSTDPQGQRRLDNPEDFVRLEITTALERRIRVIPVLVGGAAMPRPTELPDVLQPLARRQALVVGDHFHPDVDRLIAALETVLGTAPSSQEQAASIRPPPKQAPPENDKPSNAVPRREEAATSLGSAKDQPEVHRYTTSSTRETIGLSRRQKRSLWWVGGVLLCVLVSALYLVLLGRTPGPQSQDSTITTPRPPTQESSSARNTEGNQPASPLTNSLGMQFALIPAGEFQMGSTSGDDDERPVHTVRISKPFYLGSHEVTQGQWEAVMGNNPSQFKGDANRPVEMVSWEEVQTFIAKLNAREGGTKYRLPTEAEWEYAARAGSAAAYSFGYGSSQLGQYAWFGDNAGKMAHTVGKLQPNAWGLYDMHDNISEWVQDWYGKYTAEPVTDPQGPASGPGRVIRGGNWGYYARSCRSAYRGNGAPSYRYGDLGFRLLRTAP